MAADALADGVGAVFHIPLQMGQSDLLHSLHIPSLQAEEIVPKLRRPLPKFLE